MTTKTRNYEYVLDSSLKECSPDFLAQIVKVKIKLGKTNLKNDNDKMSLLLRNVPLVGWLISSFNLYQL